MVQERDQSSDLGVGDLDLNNPGPDRHRCLCVPLIAFPRKDKPAELLQAKTLPVKVPVNESIRGS
jgi:hypothetical protein